MLARLRKKAFPLLRLFRVNMRYMVPPASDATLRPSLTVLQCKLRQWAIWFRRNEVVQWQQEYGLDNLRIEIDCNLLEMELIQVHGRALWIRVYDLLTQVDVSTGHAELDQAISCLLRELLQNLFLAGNSVKSVSRPGSRRRASSYGDHLRLLGYSAHVDSLL